MATRGRVPLDSDLRRRAEAGLRKNLRTMAEICRKHRVPLIMCTVAANDSGFAPVATLGLSDSSETAYRTRLLERVTGNRDALANGRALAEARSLLRTMPRDALLHYISGSAAAAAGDYPEALEDFRRARDLDLMPWRAPSAHNRVIREVAAEQGGVVLADISGAFIRASGGEGVGWALMSDHVHPSVRGQELMARCLLEAVREARPRWHVGVGRVHDDAYYRDLLGDVPVEQVGLDEAMAELMDSPPMNRYNAHNVLKFREEARVGWSGLSDAERRGALRWKEHREQVPLVLEVADELFRAGDLDRARRHYAAARREAPFTLRGDLWAAVQWGWTIRLEGRAFTPHERRTLHVALERVDFLAATPAGETGFLSMVRGILCHFLGRHEEARQELEIAFACPQLRRQFAYAMFPALAEELVARGRVDLARSLADRASAAEGGNRYFAELVETLAAGGRLGPPR